MSRSGTYSCSGSMPRRRASNISWYSGRWRFSNAMSDCEDQTFGLYTHASMRLRLRIHNWIAAHRQTAVGQAFRRLGLGLWRASENDGGSLGNNGEAELLRRLASHPGSTVFDVGAFHGDWTARAIASWPRAQVHCFDLASEHVDFLHQRFDGDPRVLVNAFGLGEGETDAIGFRDPKHPEMTSVVLRDGLAPGTVAFDVRIRRGDDYVSQHGIDHIDILKVDTEGLDLAVLRGFSSTLAAGRIDLIQFEFTLWAAISRTWLHDFYDLLTPLGFQLGKLFPDGVEWRPYQAEHEIFLRCNYVAVHWSRPDLAAALASRY